MRLVQRRPISAWSMPGAIALALVVWLLAVVPAPAGAHPGDTDPQGGHYCRKNCAQYDLEEGEYHRHPERVAGAGTGSASPPAPAPAPAPAPGPAPAPAGPPATARPIGALRTGFGGTALEEGGTNWGLILVAFAAVSAGIGVMRLGVQFRRR